MNVETQLRSLAEAVSAQQRPVTAAEAIARVDVVELFEPPADRRYWVLVAAAIALLLGLLAGLFAWVRTPQDQRPVVSIPEGMVNEPTLDYRDDVEWWVPRELPDGWRYGYAVEDGPVQTIRLLADDRSTIDVEFGADGATIGEIAVGATTEDIGGVTWQVADNDVDGVVARVVDGRVLAVRGPLEPARIVAAELQLVAETELVRPPFRTDAEPGPVVLTLSAEEVGGDEPFELRAHTDGLFTTVGGEIKQVSADDPLAFGDYVYELTGDAESYRVVVTGFAFSRAEQLMFGLLGGDAVDVTTTDSDRFAENFYAFVIDVPASALENYEQGTLERLTSWSFAWVDGEQLVYDEPASSNCVNCEVDASDVSPATTPETTTPLVFEPTNVFGDELWMVPTEVPDNFEFAYAAHWQRNGEATQNLTYRSVGHPEPAGKELWVWTTSTTDGSAVSVPTVLPQNAVEIGGETWSWVGDETGGVLSGVVDDRIVRIEVWGDRSIAVAAAETLKLVPEAQLPRPPFRLGDVSTSVVVTTRSGLTTSDVVPTELRASTDGVMISFDGITPTPASFDGPVTSKSMTGRETGSGTAVFVISGITKPEVATLEFLQFDGEVITVVPEDLSGRFGFGFFYFAVETPINYLTDGLSVVASVIARDADGVVLAIISAPI